MNRAKALYYRIRLAIPLSFWLCQRDGLLIGWRRRIGQNRWLTNYTHWLDLLWHPIIEWRYMTQAMPASDAPVEKP